MHDMQIFSELIIISWIICCCFSVPTASSRYNHIKQRTTYDRHYNDNSAPVVQQIKDVSRRLEAEALKKYYDKAAVEGKSYTLCLSVCLSVLLACFRWKGVSLIITHCLVLSTF